MFDFCIYERFWSGWIVFCQGLSEVRVNFYKEGTKAKSQQESLNENRWRNPDVQGGESETDLWWDVSGEQQKAISEIIKVWWWFLFFSAIHIFGLLVSGFG